MLNGRPRRTFSAIIHAFDDDTDAESALSCQVQFFANGTMNLSCRHADDPPFVRTLPAPAWMSDLSAYTFSDPAPVSVPERRP